MKALDNLTLASLSSPATYSSHADVREAGHTDSAPHCLQATERSAPSSRTSVFHLCPSLPTTFLKLALGHLDLQESNFGITVNLKFLPDVMTYCPVPLWVGSGFWVFWEHPLNTSVTHLTH